MGRPGHPGEEDTVESRRCLGWFAVTVCMGALLGSCIPVPEGPPPPAGPPPGGGYPGGPGAPAGGLIEAGCTFSAQQLQGDPGAMFQIACPPGCESTGGLWGTDVYTADSAICKAAIHAGAISPGGGVATVRIESGRPAYRGSARYGVLSNDYGSYPRSYTVFPGAGGQQQTWQGAPPQPPPGQQPWQGSPPPGGYPPPPPPGYPGGAPQAIEAGCSFSANEIQDTVGSTHLISCPPGCASTGGLWGSNPYTADSAICRAAIHEGLIGNNGGTVAVTLEPGRPAYRGSQRNGIVSNDYGSYPKSFHLQRP
jgi:hypothetical protein